MRDRVVRGEVAGALRRDGYLVLDVDTSLQAVRELADWILADDRADRPDCIVTDAPRPGCGGVALVAELRALGWTMPAVLIARADDLELRRCAAALAPVWLVDAPAEPGGVCVAVRAACPPVVPQPRAA